MHRFSEFDDIVARPVACEAPVERDLIFRYFNMGGVYRHKRTAAFRLDLGERAKTFQSVCAGKTDLLRLMGF